MPIWNSVLNRFLIVKELVGAFNKEKVQVGAFDGHFDISRSHVESSSVDTTSTSFLRRPVVRSGSTPWSPLRSSRKSSLLLHLSSSYRTAQRSSRIWVSEFFVINIHLVYPQEKKKFNINKEELIQKHTDIDDPPTQPFYAYDYVQPLNILSF